MTDRSKPGWKGNVVAVAVSTLLCVVLIEGSARVFEATEKGKPVASTRYNSFPHAWDELRKAAKVPDAPAFKALRKTSANALRKIAGEEVADVHLAHAEKLKMIGPYADKLWDEHQKATQKLRAAFKSVWS